MSTELIVAIAAIVTAVSGPIVAVCLYRAEATRSRKYKRIDLYHTQGFQAIKDYLWQADRILIYPSMNEEFLLGLKTTYNQLNLHVPQEQVNVLLQADIAMKQFIDNRNESTKTEAMTSLDKLKEMMQQEYTELLK